MTKREKAIVMAYTGTCMLADDNLGIYYQYVQDKLGHCIMTHELAYPEVQDAIKEAAREDFIELCRQSDEPRVMTLDELLTVGDVWKYNTPPYLWMDVNPDIRLTDGFWVAWRDISNAIRGLNPKYTDENYSTDWRCWTARPTDEQREAVKWE